jgi:hypothetical protein
LSQTYDFLVHTYDTERLKTLGVWSMFADADLAVRPHAVDRRGRSFLEQMVHQCVSLVLQHPRDRRGRATPAR